MESSSILDAIKNDLDRQGSYDRYPVRFFSMKYASDTANVIMKLRSDIEIINLSNVEIIDVKDFLPHEDGWVTVDNLRNHIDNLDMNKSYIIVGFSEYARFLSNAEFITMIIGLLETENSEQNYKRRIYIPCLALFSQIQRTVKENHRRMDAYNPFLNDVNIEDLPIIYFINEALDKVGYENEINTSSEWFGMWRNPNIDVGKPIICTSKRLLFFYGKACPDNVYNIKKIMAYEELLESLYEVSNILPAKIGAEKHYKKLLELLKENKGMDLQNIILKKINTQKIIGENVYSLWKNTDEFGRWLIQNYVLKYEKSMNYLGYVMKSLDTLSSEEYVEAVYSYIFVENNRYEVERKELIKAISKTEEIRFNERMNSYYQRFINSTVKNKTTYEIGEIKFEQDACIELENVESVERVIQNDVVSILTSCSDYERKLILWLYRSGFISDNCLKDVYLDLENYLSKNDLDLEDSVYFENIIEYFNVYRKARMQKTMAEKYDRQLIKWNKNEETFFSWYTDSNLKHPEIILKQQGFEGNTYVLDGVGAEYMEYIVSLLNAQNVNVEFCSYAKSHLPSITSVAKDLYDMKYKWVLDYDNKVIHDQFYYPVISLEKALSVIKDMINKIILEEGSNVFAITADHGSSVGHKILKKQKKYNYSDAEHDGRCFLLPAGTCENSTDDYLLYTDDKNKDWLIALNEQSLCNNSKYVVHGGATPEEVIIPVVIAQKARGQTRSYKVKPINLKVSGLNKELSFKITPKPDKVKIEAKDGTSELMTYDDVQKAWCVNLKRGIEQELILTIDGKEYKFKTVPPTRMGDDLFDD